MRKHLWALFVLAAIPILAQEDDEQWGRSGRWTEPGPGHEGSAAVGERVLVEAEGNQWAWAELSAATRVSNSGQMLEKGRRLWLMKEEDKLTGCTREGGARFCLEDRDGDGRFEKVRTIGGGKPAAVSAGYKVVWQPGEEAVRRELVFLGTDGSVYRFSVREYAGTATTPSVASDVQYPRAASGPTEVTFRSAKLEVQDGEGGAIRFRIIGDGAGR
jgi:hypothetical protein